MLLSDRVLETVDLVDFYFSPTDKVFTKEYHPENIPLAVKGELREKYYIRAVYKLLEDKSLNTDKFSHCKNYDDLALINI